MPDAKMRRRTIRSAQEHKKPQHLNTFHATAAAVLCHKYILYLYFLITSTTPTWWPARPAPVAGLAPRREGRGPEKMARLVGVRSRTRTLCPRFRNEFSPLETDPDGSGLPSRVRHVAKKQLAQTNSNSACY